jgi:hypothetical protein
MSRYLPGCLLLCALITGCASSNTDPKTTDPVASVHIQQAIPRADVNVRCQSGPGTADDVDPGVVDITIASPVEVDGLGVQPDRNIHEVSVIMTAPMQGDGCMWPDGTQTASLVHSDTITETLPPSAPQGALAVKADLRKFVSEITCIKRSASCSTNAPPM